MFFLKFCIVRTEITFKGQLYNTFSLETRYVPTIVVYKLRQSFEYVCAYLLLRALCFPEKSTL